MGIAASWAKCCHFAFNLSKFSYSFSLSYPLSLFFSVLFSVFLVFPSVLFLSFFPPSLFSPSFLFFHHPVSLFGVFVHIPVQSFFCFRSFVFQSFFPFLLILSAFTILYSVHSFVFSHPCGKSSFSVQSLAVMPYKFGSLVVSVSSVFSARFSGRSRDLDYLNCHC